MDGTGGCESKLLLVDPTCRCGWRDAYECAVRREAGRVEELKGEVARLKAELAGLKTRLHSEIQIRDTAVERELRAEIDRLRRAVSGQSAHISTQAMELEALGIELRNARYSVPLSMRKDDGTEVVVRKGGSEYWKGQAEELHRRVAELKAEIKRLRDVSGMDAPAEPTVESVLKAYKPSHDVIIPIPKPLYRHGNDFVELVNAVAKAFGCCPMPAATQKATSESVAPATEPVPPSVEPCDCTATSRKVRLFSDMERRAAIRALDMGEFPYTLEFQLVGPDCYMAFLGWKNTYRRQLVLMNDFISMWYEGATLKKAEPVPTPPRPRLFTTAEKEKVDERREGEGLLKDLRWVKAGDSLWVGVFVHSKIGDPLTVLMEGEKLCGI